MLELLSPAGSPEAVTAAVQNGANAVYLGCGDFNARRRAKNFTTEDLAQAVAYCHVRGVKVYLTLNTLVSDRELPGALELAAFANDVGVDAVLVQDLGLAAALRAAFPDLPLHGSTQMTVHSLAGVELCAKLGLERVVLSRELSREAIAHICQKSPIEIEVFVHGALCMCYSGQCFLSAMVGTRSGNRGLCAQPCRLPYSGGHPLSLKDSSLAGHLRELDEMGVACVKIEGRMKRPEYVAIVTKVYAAAIREHREPTAEELRQLQEAFSRSGFTQGYYLDKKGAAMFGTRTEAEAPEALYAAARESYRKEQPLVPLDLTASLFIGQEAQISYTDPLGNCVKVVGSTVEERQNPEVCGLAEMEEQLIKTGGTPYYVNQTEAEGDYHIFLPKSALNAMRRRALDELSALRAQPPERRHLELPPLPEAAQPPAEPRLVFTLHAAGQLTKALWSLPHSRMDVPAAAFVTDPDKIRQALEEGAVLSVRLPRVCWDSQRDTLERQLEAAAALGVRDALVPTWDLLSAALERGFAPHGDFGLGVYNSRTLAAMKALGFQSATVSFEMKWPMIRDLVKIIPGEAIVYGRLPLMMLEQYPGGQPTDGLTDRLGVTFPTLEAPGGRCELLNSQTLWLADKAEWRRAGLSNARFLFTLEEPEACPAIVRAYLEGGQPPKQFTRGLYYRDVE